MFGLTLTTPRPKVNTTNKHRSRFFRHTLLAAMVGLLVAACGGDVPAPVNTNPPPITTITTVTPSPVETPTTNATTTTVTDVETTEGPSEETTTTTTTEEAETTTTSAPVIADTTTDTTTDTTQPEEQPRGVPTDDLVFEESLLGTRETIRDTLRGPVVLLTPSTAEEVVGWSHVKEKLGGQGGEGIKIMLEGWTVGHYRAGDGTEAEIVLSLLLVADFEDDSQFDTLSLFAPDARSRGDQPVVASRVVFRSTTPAPVAVDWVDPTIWAAFVPGEERYIQVRLTIPGDTDHLMVTVADAVAFDIRPQDPGEWGQIAELDTASTTSASTTEELFSPCRSSEECSAYGLDGYDRVELLLLDAGADWVDIQLRVLPQPTTREGLSSTDVQAWYQPGGEVWYPSDDAWYHFVENRGAAFFFIEMPVRAEALYVRWVTPDGTELLWKTIGLLKDTLFANPGWVWESANAVPVADRVCWAYWTGNADPYEMFDGSYRSRLGEEIPVTPEMIDWAVGEVCN